jgi:glutamyl/glutaminyl-tRNA synthetase
MQLRSRIAPTPSGYLHIGNALNFVLTWLWVRKQGGKLRLRIDDRDTVRSRPEYVEDIFRTFEWMGLDWDEGPQTPVEQERIYSQALRGARYDEVVELLIKTGKVFACECSRKLVHNQVCNCSGKKLALNHPDTALRIVTPFEPVTVMDLKKGAVSVNLNDEMRNFVIRRRDGITAYQLFSLTDDLDFDTNLILRGEDLLRSTAAQLYLASLLPPNSFGQTTFYHHPLIHDEQGAKLSKSAGSLSLKTMREQGVSKEKFYLQLSAMMGLKQPGNSLHELLVLEDVLNFI